VDFFCLLVACAVIGKFHFVLLCSTEFCESISSVYHMIAYVMHKRRGFAYGEILC